MVLYEDLRVYTIWRTEMSQYKQQQIQYKKAPEEWEILGELAERLHHGKEGVEAYQQCLATKFSPKAMKGVLTNWQREGDIRSTVGAMIRLICWQYRWYSEVGTLNSRSIMRLADYLYSFHQLCSRLYAVLSRMKVLSRFEAWYRQQHCLSMSSTSPISTFSYVQLSEVVAQIRRLFPANRCQL